MQLTDSLPGFDVSPFKQPCPREGCEGHLVLDHAHIHTAPVTDGQALLVLLRCLERGCGRAPRYEPMITAEEESHLRSLWDEVSTETLPEQFYPWSEEHTTARDQAVSEVYSQEEWQIIEERLTEYGYW